MLKQIALVSQSQQLNASDLALGSAALQRQATRDVARFWPIEATVDSFGTLEDVPIGYWPIVVMDKINQPGVAGFHTDEHGQPFAVIEYSPAWTLSASHEMIEMLVDPFGKTLVPGDSLDPDNPGRVQYLMETCDPCQDPSNSYTVNGLPVSEFYTQRYFDPDASPGVQYSVNGKITKPREILQGGYITWHNLTENTWFQASLFGAFQIRNLGQINTNGRSIRERIDNLTRSIAASQPRITESFISQSREVVELAKTAASARGRVLRDFMEHLQ